MSLLQQAPRLTLLDAARVAKDLYGLDADATVLPSERDQNFLLTLEAGDQFVLKIANATEPRANLEAQNAAMKHLARRFDICPRVIPAKSGEDIARLPGMPHDVRLLTYLRGTPLARLPRRSRALVEDLGRRIGELDALLADFDHPAIHRDFHWDLAHAEHVIDRNVPLVADRDLARLVRQVCDRARQTVDAHGPYLRRGPIHNDANDWNALADGDRIVGIIDFGDMVASWTVADPAVAIAYAVLDDPDPLDTAGLIARGYCAANPLGTEEIGALFPLVCLRLCLSVCVAAEQMQQRPDDEYLAVSQAPIRRTLPRLAAIDQDAAERHLQHVCGLSRRTSGKAILAARQTLIGSNLSVAYRKPVHLVRGSMQYVFDAKGRRYIDGYNNVPHVGHCHPRVVDAAERQMRLLNTNTRYLHENLERFAERVAATMPDPLRVCYFVNSGSEANELALRLARAHTRRRDLIVLDAAYHGNTTTLIDISPYKFNGPGGGGKPDWVHIAPIPDVYRGAVKRDDPRAGEKYAAPVAEIVERLHAGGKAICGFIAETCPSVGGQIMCPPGYLAAVYRHVRGAGGLCIADEVQTAYGRLGTHFYGFEEQDVVPDIVVLGKPIGNGHPIGAVVTTAAIARSFANGMEFFSTFGGSTVACAIGLAVLDVLEQDQLQTRAHTVGEHLLSKLRPLVGAYPLVGDVRGSGLFIGVELVRDRESLTPAAEEASDVINRLRDEGILIGTDGPFHNVLKIRPPMPFTTSDADDLVSALRRVLERC